MTRVTKNGWRALLLVVTVGMSAAANDASGNAALVYWQAFDGLKDVNTQDYQQAMSTPLMALLSAAALRQ